MEEKTNQNYSKVTKYQIQSRFDGIFGDEDNSNKDISPIPLPQKQKIVTKGFAIHNSKENLQEKKLQDKKKNSQLPSKPMELEKKQETPSKSEINFELPIEYNPFPNLNQIPVKQYIPKVQVSKEPKLIPQANVSPLIEDNQIALLEKNKEIKGSRFPPPIPNRVKPPSKNRHQKITSKPKENNELNLVEKKDKDMDLVESETNEEEKVHYYSEIEESEERKVGFNNCKDNQTKGKLSNTNMMISPEVEEQNDSSKKDKFKPYSLNDYKILKQENPIRMGGLGPNIGGKEWEEKMFKKNKVGNFAEEVRLLNKGLQPIKKPRNSSLDIKRSEAKQKADKVKEYAKKIPRPKIKKESSKGLNDLKGQEDLENLEQKHNKYNSEIEKIKQLIKE